MDKEAMYLSSNTHIQGCH